MAALAEIHHALPVGFGGRPAHLLADQLGLGRVHHHPAILVQHEQIVVPIEAHAVEHGLGLRLGLWGGQGGGQGLDPAHGEIQHRLQSGFPLTHQVAMQGTGRDEQQCDEADQRHREQQHQFATHGDITELEHSLFLLSRADLVRASQLAGLDCFWLTFI
ncbi:hypothetical protein D3C81_460100 [compost metagenome]